MIKSPVKCSSTDCCGLVSHDYWEDVISCPICTNSLSVANDYRRLFTVVVFSDTKRTKEHGILVAERIAKLQFAPLSESAKIGNGKKRVQTGTFSYGVTLPAELSTSLHLPFFFALP